MEFYIESQDILKSAFYIEKNTGVSAVSSRHFHSYYEFYFLADGNIDYLVDDKIYKLTSRSLLVIPPYAIHRNVDSSACGHTRIVIYINKEVFPEIEQFSIKFLDEPSLRFYSLEENEEIGKLILSLLYEFENHKNKALAKLKLLELLLLLERREKVYKSSVEKQMKDKQISKIINYINHEYATDLTLDYLAKYFGLNPTYLSRFFKKQTGFNFSSYLNNLRISKAVNILDETEYNVSETANAVGFHSVNHFCKIFKSIMGVSPLSYKKQKKNKFNAK